MLCRTLLSPFRFNRVRRVVLVALMYRIRLSMRRLGVLMRVFGRLLLKSVSLLSKLVANGLRSATNLVGLLRKCVVLTAVPLKVGRLVVALKPFANSRVLPAYLWYGILSLYRSFVSRSWCPWWVV